jgi:SAM-dependent methyltransferase
MKGKHAAEQPRRAYLPAAGSDWALPLYDPFVKLFGGDAARKPLLEQGALGIARRVLDIGCGTGTLATLIKQRFPNVEVVGLDPDPKALDRAKRKARRANVPITFEQGFADELAYPNASFDRVFSVFMFHHLTSDEQAATLREVRRVLVPGGSIYVLDFIDRKEHPGVPLARLLHAPDHLNDNSLHRILTMMSGAGFTAARKVMDGSLFFGRVQTGYHQASVPAIEDFV